VYVRMEQRSSLYKKKSKRKQPLLEMKSIKTAELHFNNHEANHANIRGGGKTGHVIFKISIQKPAVERGGGWAE
jgi:hypothetical protein